MWRQANGFHPEDIILIFAGGEWTRKGLDIAIQTLAQIPVRTVKLFVAGHDAELRRFKSLARELGVLDRVTFGGFRRDMAVALGAADIFFFPSRYEAFSLATIEAAACGLPLVALASAGQRILSLPEGLATLSNTTRIMPRKCCSRCLKTGTCEKRWVTRL